MFRFGLKLFSRQITSLSAPGFAVLLLLVVPVAVTAQRSKGDSGDDKPIFSEFRGVHLGMTTEEARKKLGSPRDKSDEQDFYTFSNDTQAIQIYYDKGMVMAISIMYLEGATGIPACKEVLGIEGEKKADGSIYKLIRYAKAGYWVSWSRTAGNEPTVTITMQRIQ